MTRVRFIAGLCVGVVVCASVDALACSRKRTKIARYDEPVDLDESPGVRPGRSVFYATPVAFDSNDFWMEDPPGEVWTRPTLTVRVNDVLLGDVRTHETVELSVDVYNSGCTRTNAVTELYWREVIDESDEVMPGREILVDLDTSNWLGLTRRRAYSGRHWSEERLEGGSIWRVLEPGETHARSFEELALRLNHDTYGAYVGKGLLPLKSGIVIETKKGPVVPAVPSPEQVPELPSFEDELALMKARAAECVPEPEWAEALRADLIVHGVVTSAYHKGAHGEVSYRFEVSKAYKLRAPNVPDEVTLYSSELTPGLGPEMRSPYLIYARGTAMGYVASACGASRPISEAPWRVGPWLGVDPGARVFEKLPDEPVRIWGGEAPGDAELEEASDEPRSLEVFASEFDASGGRAALWASLIALVAVLMAQAYRRQV